VGPKKKETLEHFSLSKSTSILHGAGMALLPIVARELRVASRRPWTYWVRFFSGLGLMLLFLILLLSDPRNNPTRLGHEVFFAMSMLVLGLCMLSGLFLTADLLSEEKREGTLGLLFLTPLKTYDVVLGKLAASSLQAVFAVVSLFPVLALPLLLGSVTGAEFARVLLVLLVTIFCSLALGLMASSVSYEARQALTRTLLLILAFAGLGPLLWLLQSLFGGVAAAGALRWCSPGFAFAQALEPPFRTGGVDFVCSMVALWLLALISGFIACFKLHRSIRADPTTTLHRSHDAGFSAAPAIPPLVGLENPFYWLTLRHYPMRNLWNRLLLLVVPIWLLLVALTFVQRPGTTPVPFIIAMALLYGLHQLLKIFMSIESTRRFSEDRQTGALELLLVSPLPVAAMIEGHAQAMRRRFFAPIVSLGILNAIFMLALLLHPTRVEMGAEDAAIFCAVSLGAILLLFADFRALLWLGMWRSMVAKRHHRAVLFTLLAVMALPWFCVFLMFTGVGEQVGSFRAITTAVGIWFAGCLTVNYGVSRFARRRLLERLRAAATQSPR
jgi:ABC-type transport system involved in multi-copper enzyme maturation permease subunit